MAVDFGLAIKNFVGPTETPDVDALYAYAERAEALGFESLWAWDHIILGVEPAFPVLESIGILTALAARTTRIKLGTGVMVLPLRNPVVVAKQLGTLDQISKGRLVLGVASGWYAREFDAVGVPFKQRGKLMDRNLDLLIKLWTEDHVRLQVDEFNLRSARLLPRPTTQHTTREDQRWSPLAPWAGGIAGSMAVTLLAVAVIAHRARGGGRLPRASYPGQPAMSAQMRHRDAPTVVRGALAQPRTRILDGVSPPPAGRALRLRVPPP